MHDGYDKSTLIELHKLMDQECAAQVTALHEQVQDQLSASYHTAEIIKLPGLHERKVSRSRYFTHGLRQQMSEAVIIAFPLPQWKRIAERRRRR